MKAWRQRLSLIDRHREHPGVPEIYRPAALPLRSARMFRLQPSDLRAAGGVQPGQPVVHHLDGGLRELERIELLVRRMKELLE